MDSDEELRAAITQQCRFAIVRVESVSLEKAGTRSQTVVYQASVERTLDSALPSPVTFKHFGQPQIEAGRHYAVGALDSVRFQAWRLCFAAVTDAEADRAAADLQQRLAPARTSDD